MDTNLKNKVHRCIQFVSLILLMLVAGAFWGTWFTLTRSIHIFTAPEFIHIGKGKAHSQYEMRSIREYH